MARRVVLKLSLILVALAGVAAIGFGGSHAVAQDASPAASPAATPRLTSQLITSGATTAYPTAPGTVSLIRFFFDAGIQAPIQATKTSIDLYYVDGGSLIFTVDAPVTITRGGGAPPEAVAAGTEFVLNNGDSIVVPAQTGGSVRNDGPDQAILIAIDLAPSAPAATGTPAATPAP